MLAAQRVSLRVRSADHKLPVVNLFHCGLISPERWVNLVLEDQREVRLHLLTLPTVQAVPLYGVPSGDFEVTLEPEAKISCGHSF
jgi:hypothetical protein